jgi:hypothetical protein
MIDQFLERRYRHDPSKDKRVRVCETPNSLRIVLPSVQAEDLQKLMKENEIVCHPDGEGFGHSFFVIGGNHPPVDRIQEILDSVH